jgi:hypothetical protein
VPTEGQRKTKSSEASEKRFSVLVIFEKNQQQRTNLPEKKMADQTLARESPLFFVKEKRRGQSVIHF